MNTILQWNCDGLYSHFEEFNIILKEHNPYICCFQETKFKYEHQPKFKNFNSFSKNHYSETVAHGGVTILVNSNFDSEEIELDTNLQAIAVKIYFPLKFVICNIHYRS